MSFNFICPKIPKGLIEELKGEKKIKTKKEKNYDYYKKYYDVNKKKIKEQSKEYKKKFGKTYEYDSIYCESCNKEYGYNYYKNHLSSKYHQNRIQIH
jgi:hypothetical protein